MKKREKKEKSKARKIIEWVLTGVFALLFVGLAAGQIDGMIHRKENFGQSLRFGYGSFVVETDSMEPEYPVHTAIITHKEDPEKLYQAFTSGETLDITFFHGYRNASFHPDDASLNTQISLTYVPMTHRIREIHIDESVEKGKGRYMFVAAGINSGGVASLKGQYQLFTEEYILGRVVVNSPALGVVFRFVSSPWGLLVLLLIPAFYLVITSVMDIFKALKEPDQIPAQGEEKKTSGAVELSEKDKERLKKQMLEEMLSKQKGDKQ